MFIIQSNILHIKYKEGINIEQDDIRLIQRIYADIADPKPKKVIQDLSFGITMSPDARKYAAENSPELDAVAYIIKGLGHRILIRFYTRMRRIDKPTKFFDNYKGAKDWLDTI